MKNKQILSLFLAIFICTGLLVVLSVSSTAEKDGDFSYIVVNGNATVTNYAGNSKVLAIPSTLDGYPVTSIDDYAFYNCSNLTRITIPESVTSIGNYAFYNCDSLISLFIGNDVTSIGYYAFWGCTSLENITIGNHIASIGVMAFNNTAYYNDISNWQNGMLIIDGWLIAVDENTQHLSRIEDLRGVATDAYLNAYRLQTAVWEANVTPPSNVETLTSFRFISSFHFVSMNCHFTSL